MLSEKEENLSHLQDRLNLLEQRQQDSQLTGDERLTAVQAEVNRNDRKLSLIYFKGMTMHRLAGATYVFIR